MAKRKNKRSRQGSSTRAGRKNRVQISQRTSQQAQTSTALLEAPERSKAEVGSLQNIENTVWENFNLPLVRTQKLSVCVIVKDEERVLRRALQSLQGVADEIVVVDTGCKDNTMAIAEEFGCVAGFFQWNNNFADARNYSMNLATGDWILIMDADEEFEAEDKEKILRYIENPDMDQIAILLRNFFPCEETQTNESLSNKEKYRYTANHLPRLLRNKQTIRYHKRIHEDISPDAVPPERRFISDISIWHYGYCYQDDRKERRAVRNKHLTNLYLEENPTDPTAYHYVGSTHLAAGRIDEAVHCFEQVLEHASVENDLYIHFRVMALFHLSRQAALREDWKTEEKYSVEAILIEPEYLDAWLRVGEAFFHLDKFWMAERAFHRYRSLLKRHRETSPRTRYTLYQLGMDHMATYYLGRLAEYRFDSERAKKFYQMSIELDAQRSTPAHFYLALIYARERNYHKMDQHLAKARSIDSAVVDTLMAQDHTLPGIDKSDNGSPERSEGELPDPTAVFAASMPRKFPEQIIKGKKGKEGIRNSEAEATAESASSHQPSTINHQPSGLPSIFWSGEFFNSGDWAEQSRYLLNAAHESFDIYIQPTGETDPELPLSDEGSNRIKSLTGRGVPGLSYIHLWDMPPSHVKELDTTAHANIARLDWPTDRLPQDWAEKCRHFDQIWVPSSHHRKMLMDEGIASARIRILHGAIDTESFSPDREIQPLPLDCLDKFNFVAVFDWDDTHAWKQLLNAYCNSFKVSDSVNLIMKPDITSGIDSTTIEQEIISYLKSEGHDLVKLPSILFLTHRLPAEHMAMLYRTADAFIMPGYSGAASPHIMEAMAMGLPVVAARWGAHLDYLDDSNAFLIDVETFAKTEHENYNGHRWAQPSEEHLKKTLQAIFNDPTQAREIGRSARETAVRELDVRTALNRMIENLRELGGGDKGTEPSPPTLPHSHTPTPSSPLHYHAKVFERCERVLCMGDGSREFGEELLKLGVDAAAFTEADTIPADNKWGAAHLELVKNAAKEGETFDGIYAAGLLECLTGPDAGELLETLKQLLKPDGYLFCRSINWSRKETQEGFYADQRHIRPYPMDLTFQMFIDAGFELAYYGMEVENQVDLITIARRPITHHASRINHLRIMWRGPVFACNSLSWVNRNYIRQLRKQMDAEICIDPATDVILEGAFHPSCSPDLLDLCGAKAKGKIDLTVTLFWPPDLQAASTGHWIHIQPWEYGSMQTAWFETFQSKVDEIWTFSNHTRDGFIADGIDPKKIKVIPLAVEPEIFNTQAAPSPLIDSLTQKKFKFFFCGGTIARKGIDVLINAYLKEFTSDDNTCLIIKDMGTGTFYGDQNVGEKIAELTRKPGTPEIVYLNETFETHEMAGLYRACNVLVHPYRGEGFGLPVAEAMSCGLPVIVSRGGSCDDFCPPNDTWWVDTKIEPCPYGEAPTVRQPYWLAPSMDSLRQQMRQAYSNPAETAERGARSATYVSELLSWEKIGKLMAERIEAVRSRPPVRG